jgi:TetR/AcrR family transcriptional regulator, cholesterol catabolism regulator
MVKKRPQLANPDHDQMSRKDALMQLAVEIIRERGYDRTTMKDIAIEFGVTEPAVYYYFNSKEELLFTIVKNALELSLQEAKKISNDHTLSPEDKLRRFILNSGLTFSENKLFPIFFREKERLSPEHQEEITEGERQFVNIMNGIYEAGVANGDFKPYHSHVVTFGILGMTAWIYRWFEEKGSLTLTEVLNSYCDIMINGVKQ